MSEICLECWNKINQSNYKKYKYILSKEEELCEECGQLKRVIVVERKYYYMRKFCYIIFPFKVIFMVIYVLWRIAILPYLIYKYKNDCPFEDKSI